MGSAQAHTREEYDHIQAQWGSILKPYGIRWSNPLTYILVIYFQFFQWGTHVDYTLNTLLDDMKIILIFIYGFVNILL